MFVFDLKILILVSAVINFVLSWIIFRQSKGNKVNFSFSLFVLFLGIWSLCFYFYFHPVIFSHLTWIKLVYLVSFFIIPPAFYFILSFPVKRIKSFLLPGTAYTICSLFLIWLLFFTDFWIKKITVDPSGPQIITGNGYVFYFIFIGILGFFGFYNLIRNFLSAKRILKTQLKFIFFGLFLFGIPTIIIDVVLPILRGDSSYFWLSPIFSLFFVGSTAYAITRYRLMDIRVVIGRGVVYFFSFVSVITLALSLLFLNNQLVRPVSVNIVISLVLIVGITLFRPLFRYYEKLASKHFYYTFYNYQAVLNDLGKNLTQVLELDKLSSLIVNTLINTMKLDRTVILLRGQRDDKYQIQKNIGFREENGISLVKDNFLTIWLEKNQKALVYEELFLAIRDATNDNKREKLKNLQSNMKRIEANVCLPLFSRDRIIGMIVLGCKVSGESYSKQDIELLINLSNQASIALQNARLYQEIKDLTENLEKRVEDQIENIEELSKMKSEFLKVVNHQLRTPVSIIKGMASMLDEGSVKGKQKEDFIKKLYLSSERLTNILDDILVAQNLVGGKESANLSLCSIEEIIREQVDHLSPVAKSKKIEIVFEEPKEPLPLILLDQAMMAGVVFRLIDNAILYTPTEKAGEGIRVSVSLEKEKNGKELTKISVKDSGIGIEEKEKDNIFKLFYRGEKAISLHPNGSGLGIFIVSEFVKAHKGKIEVESEGRNKGTTFNIILPVVKQI